MPLAPEYFTADMVRALPNDGQRYEVVLGELLMAPAPGWRHQRIVGRLFRVLAAVCDEIGTLEAMIAPADVSWGEDTLVQPDVFIVPKELAIAGEPARAPALALVAEVWTPEASRPRIERDQLIWHVGVRGAALTIDLRLLFEA